MKKRVMITVFSCISVLWVGFIWMNSMQVGAVSGEMSGSLTESINQFFGQFIDGFYISGIFVRKLAHFLEFSMLALALCFDYYFIFGIDKQSENKKLSLVGLAFPTAFAVACIDESIQLFVDGRIGTPIDVLIDSSGALLATSIFLSVLVMRKNRKNKREAL